MPDSSPAYFSGDWIGMGAGSYFCLVRLRSDGLGTVLVSNPSGDWLGASVHWRNQRQNLVVTDVKPMPADPARRLMSLQQLTLSSGFNRTMQLKLHGGAAACELLPRLDVQRRAGEADLLLASPRATARANGAN